MVRFLSRLIVDAFGEAGDALGVVIGFVVGVEGWPSGSGRRGGGSDECYS
jgi:hypothetical protein